MDRRIPSIAARWVARIARRQTEESKRYHADEANRKKHIRAALAAFKRLLPVLKPYADQAIGAYPNRDKLSIQRRGRSFIKAVKVLPQVTAYLDEYIGTEGMNPKEKSWRSAVIYQMRNLLVYKAKQKDVLVEVGKQAHKGFQAITMAKAQAPLREILPAEILEFLPENVVVEVDEEGAIQQVTDRFENEHETLGRKIGRMKRIVSDYNEIARTVKKDLNSPDEVTRLAALVTSVIMETGIRPGKVGNGVVRVVGGDDVVIETFGAVTLGPKHVQFIREGFARLEFTGKKGSTNIARVSDQSIVKILKEYVDKALKRGSKYIFVTDKGERFSYSDLQRYFRYRMEGLSPTDFRKLRATSAVLEALHEEQKDLYARIKDFAADQKDDLRQRVSDEIVVTLKDAIERAQKALSHESAQTTLRSYIDPEIILRFLSEASVGSTLEKAILGDHPVLRFDPARFVALANSNKKGARRTASLQDILDDLEDSMEDDGVRVPAV